MEDFVILPVTDATLDRICRGVLPQVGLKQHITHVLIASEGRLVLGAYDNFQWVWIDGAIGQEGIVLMLNSGIIGWYRAFEREEQSA